jgi:hypothetical protein
VRRFSSHFDREAFGFNIGHWWDSVRFRWLAANDSPMTEIDPMFFSFGNPPVLPIPSITRVIPAKNSVRGVS